MAEMPRLTRGKMVREGAIGGLIAGATFASGQVLVAAASGFPPGAPWMYFASLVTGEAQTAEPTRGLIFLLGAAVHFGLATLYGAFFGFVISHLRSRVRSDWGTQLAGGAAYGLLLWVVNFQIIGRLLYPWYLEINPLIQVLLHGLFFGLPLAGWLGSRIRDVEVPGVHEARHRYQTSTGDEELLRLAQWKRHQDEAARAVFGGKREGPPPERDERLH